jgi:hypothetical protein
MELIKRIKLGCYNYIRGCEDDYGDHMFRVKTWDDQSHYWARERSESTDSVYMSGRDRFVDEYPHLTVRHNSCNLVPYQGKREVRKHRFCIHEWEGSIC